MFLTGMTCYWIVCGKVLFSVITMYRSQLHFVSFFTPGVAFFAFICNGYRNSRRDMVSNLSLLALISISLMFS